jgi:hypothetical protein
MPRLRVKGRKYSKGASTDVLQLFSRGWAPAFFLFLLVAVTEGVPAQNSVSAPATRGDSKLIAIPRRDLSGIWAPVTTGDGIQPNGALNMPADGKPEHDLNYTPYGLEMAKANRSSNGPEQVAAAEENDPAHACEPQGFPREELFELRATEILQNPLQVVMLYTYGKVWRIIWIDGRELPKDPDPHWYGYSVGRWKDDYTFVVQSNGTDQRTWMDNAGRPHSDDLRVEEIFHRVDRDTLELSMTINDPKVYARPWLALDKLKLRLKPANFDLAEMICSPSELAAYNKKHAARGSVKK